MTLLEHIYNQLLMIDTKDEFMFFANRKVCLQSVARYLLKDRIILKRDRLTSFLHKARQYKPRHIAQLFKFTIVRNPWDRVVSAFFANQQSPRIRYINRSMNFSGFIKNMLLQESMNFDPHFEYQYPNAFFNGKQFVDFIGKFENIRKDWAYIARQIGCSRDLPHKNKSKHELYRNYYDDQTRGIVAEIYKMDIKLFGYKF